MPYNSETETFYQAPATVVDSTPDGDTVQEGFDDRLTPAMAGLYADLNLLKADGMISVGIPATTTARGIGRVATLADMKPGAIIENGPAVLGSELLKTAPPSGTIINPGWIGSVMYNVREVLTSSGTFTASVTGWHHVTVIAGGGAGGSQARANTGVGCGGGKGGDTQFGSLIAKGGGGGGGGRWSGGSGGGGAGDVEEAFVYMEKGQSISYTIGAGGLISTTAGSAPTGEKCGYNGVSSQGNYAEGTGAQGAGNGTAGGYLGGQALAGGGGNGGRNGTGYGGGGGGATGGTSNAGGVPGGLGGDNAPDAPASNGTKISNNGSNGGPGAIIIKYFDPQVTS